MHAFLSVQSSPHPEKVPRNLLDCEIWGRKWLDENKSIIDCPTDKNLGTAILSRQYYDLLALRSLEASYVQIDHAEVSRIVTDLKQQTHEIIVFARCHDIMPEIQIRFLSCLLNEHRLPNGRLLIKVHKPKTDARLIASGTRWLTNPHACLIAKELQPFCVQHDSVAVDTQSVINMLEGIRFEKGDRIDTYDVEKLYPSLVLSEVLAAVRWRLTVQYRDIGMRKWGARVELILMLLECVFHGQILAFQFGDVRKHFKQTVGVTTGLGCAVQIANLYLLGLDEMCKNSLRSNLLGF